MPGQNQEIGKRGGCICEPCPSYSECLRANDEFMFCVRGKTPNCMFDLKGCSCPTCPVHPTDKTLTTYFCAGGKGRQPR
nr:DUF2769 domain-containing protein [uncultured Methanoregula sp.]